MLARRQNTLFLLALLVGSVMLVAGSSQARDARSDAIAAISRLNGEISTLGGRIFAGDLLIAGAKLAIAEAEKKPDNLAAVLALKLSLGLLEGKKADLLREKAEKQRQLAAWEAYLRSLRR